MATTGATNQLTSAQVQFVRKSGRSDINDTLVFSMNTHTDIVEEVVFVEVPVFFGQRDSQLKVQCVV